MLECGKIIRKVTDQRRSARRTGPTGSDNGHYVTVGIRAGPALSGVTPHLLATSTGRWGVIQGCGATPRCAYRGDAQCWQAESLPYAQSMQGGFFEVPCDPQTLRVLEPAERLLRLWSHGAVNRARVEPHGL